MNTEIPVVWLTVGFAAQTLFFLRFLVQWIHSERLGRSAVPVVFWYLSLLGSAGLLCYAIHRSDPVIILGQAFGFVVYTRNLHLIHSTGGARKTKAEAARSIAAGR